LPDRLATLEMKLGETLYPGQCF